VERSVVAALIGSEGDVAFVPAPAFGVAVRASAGGHPALLLGVVVLLLGQEADVAAVPAIRPPVAGRDMGVGGAAWVGRVDLRGWGFMIVFVRF
jgi:hypothetical protein